ncbi:MAG: hypothetical protein JSV04_07105 [Candidatus Heimdallarchaeota archaeon]|nr:MAG: hypothetical protein JSV04_07105 [Candidatus Heimdallarchaeota archaeon]
MLKLGKVIGNVVASVKDPGLDGLRLLIIQGLDDNFQAIGNPYIAADGIRTAGPGDIVYIVSRKEAAVAISKGLVPIDECVVGFVDEYTVVSAAKEKVKVPIPKVKKKPIEKKPVKARKPVQKTKTPSKRVPRPKTPPEKRRKARTPSTKATQAKGD